MFCETPSEIAHRFVTHSIRKQAHRLRFRIRDLFYKPLCAMFTDTWSASNTADAVIMLYCNN
jgi:hypothetical protein